MSIIKCWICKKDDELSNLVQMHNEGGQRIYLHQKCADKHNKTVEKNRSAFDAMSIADSISGYDLNPTDSYVVANFLKDERFDKRGFLAHRRPSVDEIVKAACKSRLATRQRELFEAIERQAKSWPKVPNEALIEELTGDLNQFGSPDEGEHPNHYAVRMMLLMMAWRKDAAVQGAFDYEYFEEVEAAEAKATEAAR